MIHLSNSDIDLILELLALIFLIFAVLELTYFKNKRQRPNDYKKNLLSFILGSILAILGIINPYVVGFVCLGLAYPIMWYFHKKLN
jgi:hypothetical protein